MAAKVPIRTVYTNSVATGLAEFQSGEFIDYAVGGTGLAALGSAGQVLKVNSGASALEYGNVEAVINIEGMTDGSGVTLAASDKFVFSDGGTEKYLLASQIDTYVSATSATLTNKTLTTPQITSGVLNTGVSGSAIKDQDDMSSDSATHLATQQSIKAYVDTQITAEDLDVTTDSGTIAIDLDSETLTVSGGTGLDSSATGNAVTLAIDSTVATLTGTQTLTNKTLTSPTINGGTFSGTLTGTADLTGIVLSGASPLVFEGATADAYETTLAFTDPTADRTITVPNATDTLVGKATTDTLTNKSVDLGNNTLTGSLAEFNTALQSESFASLSGSETLTNKTLTTPVISSISNTGTLTLPTSTDTVVGRATTDTLTNKTLTSAVLNTGVSGSAVADEDDMSSNSATLLATQQSIKAYVDATVTAEDLDVTSDSGTIDIDLDSETLTIAGGTGLDSSASSTTVTLAIDSTVATLTGTQTLTNKSLTSPTITGTAVMATLDISGDVDVDGTLETDALTIAGVTIAETIADTVGAMVGSNTETGIAVTYEDGDNTLDFALGAAQTTITSLLATDIKIGEDDQTKIDFETADEIHLYAANAEQVYVADGIFGPQTDSDVDLGTTGVRWKDAYIDSITTTGNTTIGGNLTVTGDYTVNGDTTTVNTATLSVEDPLMILASGNDSADTVDIGLYGLYDTSGSQDLYGGLFRDASDSGKWKLFKDNQAAPTTTVNTSGTGYAVGTLVASIEGAVTGNADTATALATGRTIASTGDVVWTSASFDGSGNVTGTAAIGTGVIVNADINSSAAIAFSKMADLTASRLLVSDGSGDVSVSAVTSTEAGYLDGVTSAIQTQMDTKSTKAFAIAQAVALG